MRWSAFWSLGEARGEGKGDGIGVGVGCEMGVSVRGGGGIFLIPVSFFMGQGVRWVG